MLWNGRDTGNDVFCTSPETYEQINLLSDYMSSMVSSGSDFLADDTSDSIVHQVLRTVIFKVYPLTTPHRSIPIFLFWTIDSMLQVQGRFKAPNVASKTIAALHFCMRCVVRYENESSGYDIGSITEETK